MKVVIATKNEGKVREFKKLLEPLGFQPVSMTEEGIDPEIIEDGDTFEENAHIKAREVHKLTHLPVIADDSGLEVEFLNGAPGIYSARYAGENATEQERNQKLLEEMQGVDRPLRNARFVCAIYFILDDKKEYCVTGVLDGFIGEEPQGENGFGYDPIFMIDEDTSLAEVSDREKNRISHRARALEKLAAELEKEIKKEVKN
ncbi:MAG: XTP/dITP diphosphatase [Firmicutes bacterium]|nr:XTP/dITP diphosphatase [[Eubacterium] siraeum]MCM1488517.1 XTP/dITP diphosphatase [Bacillota bacterium]